MPYDCDIRGYMKSIEDVVQYLADPAESIDHDAQKERIKNAIREAYLAGYAQCEHDYNDHGEE